VTEVTLHNLIQFCMKIDIPEGAGNRAHQTPNAPVKIHLDGPGLLVPNKSINGAHLLACCIIALQAEIDRILRLGHGVGADSRACKFGRVDRVHEGTGHLAIPTGGATIRCYIESLHSHAAERLAD